MIEGEETYEVVIRIPVKNGRFDFSKARVEGGEEIKPPYNLRVHEMVSISMQIGEGNSHYVYLHFPDCRYVKILLPWG
ncbi:hypothetical protein [Desulfatiglans anilini]|uniref:hypothetical protein n=1 Tax=Desulfatiglans anilini TaxID=90728 RepID=UPI000415AE45|nr:hypothetical protein [Desulfatiglans anilini]